MKQIEIRKGGKDKFYHICIDGITIYQPLLKTVAERILKTIVEDNKDFNSENYRVIKSQELK